MKISLQYLGMLAVALPFLGGCGKQGVFEQANLKRLEKDFESKQTLENVTVLVKRLSQKDREYTFGTKSLPFSPVLLTIVNHTEEPVLFDPIKQELQVVEIKTGYRKAGDDGSNNPYKPIMGGAGLYLVSMVGGTIGAIGNCEPATLTPFVYGGFAGLGIILYGICRLIAKANASERVYHIIFAHKSDYLIEKNSRLSLLLFFEKNNLPNLLQITLESQIQPTKTLAFDLSMNPQNKNEFIHKQL